MIGGGEYLNFQEMADSRLDQELFVRHSEIACLLPAMQFSAAPYRVLSEENFNAIRRSVEEREKYIDYMMEVLEESAQSGEPLVRYMAYEFLGEPVEELTDQFMLGSRYLVAPVCEKGRTGRELYLPAGVWERNGEEIVSAGERIYTESEYGVPIVYTWQSV